MIQYAIERDDDLAALEAKVNARLSGGWKLAGGPLRAIRMETEHLPMAMQPYACWTHAQALVKPVLVEHEPRVGEIGWSYHGHCQCDRCVMVDQMRAAGFGSRS